MSTFINHDLCVGSSNVCYDRIVLIKNNDFEINDLWTEELNRIIINRLYRKKYLTGDLVRQFKESLPITFLKTKLRYDENKYRVITFRETYLSIDVELYEIFRKIARDDQYSTYNRVYHGSLCFSKYTDNSDVSQRDLIITATIMFLTILEIFKIDVIRDLPTRKIVYHAAKNNDED